MSANPGSTNHYKSCRFEIKSTQPGSQNYVTINRYLLAIIMFKQSSYQFEKCPQNVIAMHAGKGIYTSYTGKHGSPYKTNFISLKPVLTFQTLTLATLGNWATTHQRVFFLGKNCSWTLLPGSIWLRTPITQLRYISCLRTFGTHSDSLKCADVLRVYRDLMMPLNHQADIQGTLKQCDISWQSSNAAHLFFVRCISFDARSIHVLCSCHNNRCKQSVPRFPLYICCEI